MNPDTLSQINESVAKINTGLEGTSIKPLKPITPESISGGVPVIETPPPIGNEAVQSELSKIGTDAEQQMEALTQEQQKRAAAAEQKQQTSLEDLVGSIAGQETIGELQQKAEDEFGVTKLESELQNINNQILQEQRALQKTVEEIEKNKEGALEGKVRARIFKAETESLRRQADLSVIQLAAQGKFDSAAKRADRYAAALYDRQKNVLDAKEMLFDNYKDLFDKEEQRAFELNYNNTQRKIETEREDQKTLQAVKLDAMKMAQMNGAPADILAAIQNAQTPEEVLETGGQYGSVDMLQRQIQNQTLANAVKAGRVKDYELAQLSAAEKRREEALKNNQLLPEQYEIVDTYDKDFRSEPIVKEFNEAAGARFAFENVVKNGVKGVQDLQLVYNFMKSVDPESVVRETEFDMAAETGNIFAGKFTRFNEGYFGAGGFLPPEVQQSFMNAANAAWDGKQTQYYNIKDQFGEKINRQLGIENGSSYLTSYEEGAPLPLASGIENAKVNEVIIKDGVKYRKQADGTFIQVTD